MPPAPLPKNGRRPLLSPLPGFTSFGEPGPAIANNHTMKNIEEVVLSRRAQVLQGLARGRLPTERKVSSITPGRYFPAAALGTISGNKEYSEAHSNGLTLPARPRSVGNNMPSAFVDWSASPYRSSLPARSAAFELTSVSALPVKSPRLDPLPFLTQIQRGPEDVQTDPLAVPAGGESLSSLAQADPISQLLQSTAESGEVEVNTALRKMTTHANRIAKRLQSLETLSEQMRTASLQSAAEAARPPADWAIRVQESFDHINSQLSNLHHVFYAEELKKRMWAASVIQSWIRGFLTRCKSRRAQEALRSWRRRQCGNIMPALTEWLHERELIYEKVKLIVRRSRRRVKRQVLYSWHRYAAKMAPIRLEVRNKALLMAQKKIREHLRTIIELWLESALGPHSRKKLVAAHAERYRRAEERLLHLASESGWTGDVTPHVINKEVQHDCVHYMQFKKPKKLVTQLLTAWRQFAISKKEWREKKKMAMKHYFKYLQKLNMRRWHRCVQTIKKWEGARWKEKQNELVALRAYRTRLVMSGFDAWRAQCSRLAQARKRYHQKMLLWTKAVLQVFAERVKRNRQLKLVALERWIAVGKVQLQMPFRSWYLWCVDKRLRRQAQTALMAATDRRRHRRMLGWAFGEWREAFNNIAKEMSQLEQQEIQRSLEQQRLLTQALLENQAQAQKVVQQAEDVAKKQAEQAEQYLREVTKKNDEVISLKMALHSAEQEILRLRANADFTALLAGYTAVPKPAQAQAQLPSRKRSVGVVTVQETAEARFLLAPVTEGGSSAGVGTSNFGAGPPQGQLDGPSVEQIRLAIAEARAGFVEGQTPSEQEVRRLQSLLAVLASAVGDPSPETSGGSRPSTSQEASMTGAGIGSRVGEADGELGLADRGAMWKAAQYGQGQPQPTLLQMLTGSPTGKSGQNGGKEPEEGRPGSASTGDSTFRPIRWYDFVQGVEGYDTIRRRNNKPSARAKISQRVQERHASATAATISLSSDQSQLNLDNTMFVNTNPDVLKGGRPTFP